MKQLLTRLTLTLVLAFGLALPTMVLSGPNVQAATDAKTAACEGIGAIDGSGATGCDNGEASNEATSTVYATIRNIVNIFSWVAGIAAVFMVILGGFWYITSNGDSAKTTKARQTILYALVGLVIVAFAQVIVRFVIGTLLK